MDRTYKFQWPIRRRDKISINLELQPSEYGAIGRISVQWAFLDYHITLFCTEVCDALLGEPLHKDFESDSFRKRRRAWAEVVKRAFPEGDEVRLRMEAIIQEAGEIQGQRQLAIHSFFEWDRKSPKVLKAHSHKNPRGSPRRFNVQQFDEIAEKIARLNARFIMWPNDFPELALGGAWRDIDGTQVIPGPRPAWGQHLLSILEAQKDPP